MLRQRIITAVILLMLIAAALFLLPQIGWWAVCAVVAAIAGWEWGRLAGLSRPFCVGLGGVVAGVVLGLVVLGSPLVFLSVFAGSALFWLLLAPPWLKQGWKLNRWTAVPSGLFVLVPATLALIRLRDVGPWFVLAVMAVIWTADIVAYFGGRAFGRNKLAPAISPGKTWEGAVFGVLGSLIYGGLVYAFCLPQVPGVLTWVIALGLVGVLAVLSIVGDLFESLLKRQAGVKDSSGLLPGHGGVLDRIDGLLPTLPLAALWLFAWSL